MSSGTFKPRLWAIIGLVSGGVASLSMAQDSSHRANGHVPAAGSPITRPMPRLIVQPGKPLIFTSVPQPLGEVPVAVTRAPRHQSHVPDSADGFWRPIRRGGGLGGVPARFPNVLSPARSYVPETYGPVSTRSPGTHAKPWPCAEPTASSWTRTGSTISTIGPSGAAFSTTSPTIVTRSHSVGSALAASSGFRADIDLGSVNIHIGSRPPIWGAKPDCRIDGSWSNSAGWSGGNSCRPCPNPCEIVVCYGGPSYWDSGWWTWYDTSSYYSGPVFGSAWTTYDPSYFYPPSITNPPDPAASTSQARDSTAIDELVSLAAGFMLERRFADAAVAMRDYLRREPTDAGAWRWLGMTLLGDRQTKEAVDAFHRAYTINPAMADLPLEYDAMGMNLSDLRRMTGPLLVFARNTRSAPAFLMAAVVMDARAMPDQSRKIIDEARDAGLDPSLAGRLKASFGG